MVIENRTSHFVEELRSKLPNHLRRYLDNINPYGDRDWEILQCYGAAFSFYTDSIKDYPRIQEVLLSEGVGAMMLVPTILDECFSERNGEPEYGDTAVFSRVGVHFHAGIFVGYLDGEMLILSKPTNGRWPLDIQTATELKERYEADKVVYWKAKDGLDDLGALYLEK